MNLSFAFSPCPNDTFMFEPIVSGRIDTEGIDFGIHLHDVEALNKAAFEQRYDVTKLSFGAFFKLTDKYQLLHSGSALGNHCGPLLISKDNVDLSDISNLKIAIPGKNTTAAFLFDYVFGSTGNLIEMVFSDIEQSILNGEVDAGVIIHENRFTYQEKGLKKIIDLGQEWEDRTGSPIPLGGIAVRRNLEEQVKSRIDRVIRHSVLYAQKNPESGKDFIRCHAQEMDDRVMRSHIDLYVNKYSADIGFNGRSAIHHLIDHHPYAKENSVTLPLFVEQKFGDKKPLDASFWNARWKEGATGWDIGNVSTPIKEYFDQVKNKNAAILIPGAGNGYEAEYIAKKGFQNITVVDLAQQPLDNLKNRCPQINNQSLLCCNFFDLDASHKFDIIIEQTFFCALNLDLRESYAQKMASLLAPGGKLVGLLFDFPLSTSGPPFGGSIEEYRALFSKYFDIKKLERCYNSIAPRSGKELWIHLVKKQ